MQHERRIWRMLAFLARYGHQPVSGLLDLTLAELHELQENVGRLLEDEQRSLSVEGD